MAINIHNLDGYVREPIETTGSSTALHEVGYTVRDRKTGLSYMYIKFDNGDGVASSIGAPAGVFQSGNESVTPTTVTADQSQSTSFAPVGIFRSVITDAYYGWIEIAQKHIATTVNLTTSVNDVEGLDLMWSVDSSLTNTAITSGMATSPFAVVAKALESEGNTATYVYVQWL